MSYSSGVVRFIPIATLLDFLYIVTCSVLMTPGSLIGLSTLDPCLPWHTKSTLMWLKCPNCPELAHGPLVGVCRESLSALHMPGYLALSFLCSASSACYLFFGISIQLMVLAGYTNKNNLHPTVFNALKTYGQQSTPDAEGFGM